MQRRIEIPMAFIVCLFLALFATCLACELDQTHNGCKIQGGICICGFGCKAEYRYTNRMDCMNALKERGNNICSRTPCYNKGNCIQVSQEPGFKCRCENTGYYGPRCEQACPTGPNPNVREFSYACIVI